MSNKIINVTLPTNVLLNLNMIETNIDTVVKGIGNAVISDLGNVVESSES